MCMLHIVYYAIPVRFICNIFLSFEAVIVLAILASNRQKIFLFMNNTPGNTKHLYNILQMSHKCFFVYWDMSFFDPIILFCIHML